MLGSFIFYLVRGPKKATVKSVCLITKCLYDFFSKISAKIWCFFGFKHNFHQHLMYVAYTCHTWMESCVSQQHFGTKMLGLACIIRVQGILLTVEKNPGLQPDTASYLKLF